MQKVLLLSLSFSLFYGQVLAQIPDWQQIPGPDGGHILNFDLDGKRLYALTTHGVYYSDDEGYHWEIVTSSIQKTNDKTKLQVEQGVFYALNKAGILVHSKDSGFSWVPILQKPFPINFESEYLQQYYVKGDTLLVGSNFTIYRSIDKGETWTSTLDLVPASFVSIFEYKNEYFAAQDRFIYRSNDSGKTWEIVFTNSSGFISVTATDSFLLAFYVNKTRLIRSKDGLRTWDIIDTDTIKNHLKDDPSVESPFKWIGGTGNMLYYFQKGSSHYFCPVRFCYSSDGGLTWQKGQNGKQITIGNNFKDGIIMGNHILLASSKLYHSIDSAQSFSEGMSGLKSGKIENLLKHGDNIILSLFREQGFISRENYQNWEPITANSDIVDNCSPSVSFLQTKKRLYKKLDGVGISELAYMDNNDQSWKVHNSNFTYNVISTNHSIWFNESDYQPGIGFVKRFLKLDDNETTSVVVNFSEVNWDNSPDINIFSLGDRLGIEYQNRVFIFNENTNFIRELPLSPCIEFISGTLGKLFFTGEIYYNFCNDRCYILSENSSNWQEIYPQDWTTGTPLHHNKMTFFEVHNGVIWVGLEGKGLFYATDNTGRFYPAQPQMPFPYPTALSIDEEELWVGTTGGGIWTLPTPKTLNGPLERDNFKLFPNPSSGALNLESSVFLTTEVTLSIFDTAGKRVAQKELKPGLSWALNFPNLSKGLYFLQLRTASSVVGLKWVIDH